MDNTRIIELIEKYFFYQYDIIDQKREESLFLPIKFVSKKESGSFPGIFAFMEKLFDEEEFKNTFSINATHLEFIDKRSFLVHFAFRGLEQVR